VPDSIYSLMLDFIFSVLVAVIFLFFFCTSIKGPCVLPGIYIIACQRLTLVGLEFPPLFFWGAFVFRVANKSQHYSPMLY